jgi:hypothetical protein
MHNSTHSKQQNAFPRNTFTRKQMRKLDRQDDSLLQGFLGSFQTSNIGPLHFRLFNDNCAFEFALKFLLFRIIAI